MPTARQLEVLLAVAAAGSVRRAADGLQISQPSVSKHLRALERWVGGEILIRNRGSKAQLSALGKALLDDARQTLDGQRRITRRQPSTEQQGPRLFVRQFMLESIRKRLPELYQEGLPRTTAFTVVDDTENIFARVEAEPSTFTVVRADLPPDNPDLKTTILRRESASLYASPGLLAQMQREGCGGVRQLPILVAGSSSPRSGWIRRVVSRAGINAPQWQRGSQFLDLLLEEVAGGAGSTIFIDWHVQAMVEAGRIVLVPNSTVPISVMLVAGPTADESIRQALLDTFRAFYTD